MTDDEAEPTPEQYAERARRADRATRRALAAILCLEAVVVLLLPRALARTGAGPGAPTVIGLIAFSVLLVVTGALLRHTWAIGIGSAEQFVLVGLGLLTVAFLILGVIFLGIWLWLLSVRHDLVGTPGGLRMLIS